MTAIETTSPLIAEVVTDLVTSWTYRRRFDRSHFFTAMALIVVTEVLMMAATNVVMNLSPMTKHVGALFEALWFLVGTVLATKSLIWRYRDAGRSPWWLVLQYSLNVVGFIGLMVAGIVALVSIFGSDVNRSLFFIYFFGGLSIILANCAWILVWCLWPSRSPKVVLPGEPVQSVE